MTARTLRAKQPGQSIPLIALLIVVLIGAVGLSVDVGNTYAQQRNTVRATNAAALAGMNTLIQGGTDQSISQVIQQSLKSNKIDGVYNTGGGEAAGDQRLIEAYYLDSKGNPMGACVIGACSSVPSGVNYIQVKVRGNVNTYFARVLQRPTLPVKAQAFAGRCTPTQGVYPIGVQSSNLNSSGFINPNPDDPQKPSMFSIYRDSTYPNGLTQRRIYINDAANSPGNFSFLRWKSAQNAGNNPEMINMMTGDGNIDQGFNEVVPWPDPNSQAPDGYPIKPGEPNGGDFVYANTGVSLSAGGGGVQAAIQWHITNKTVLILPIVKPAVGQGINGAFQVVGFGAFYMVGMGGNGANTYFDLVYIGNANSIACLSTPAVTSSTLGITGAVFLKPRWGQPQEGQPIAYQIIMDVSGSMSWNFNGQGSDGGSGSTLQCEANGNLAAVSCDSNDYWKTVSERRVYVLKNALTGPGGFIESLRTNDTMRIISFSSDGINTGPGWSNDKVALKQSVMDAGKVANDPYKTSGGTPGPRALQQAYSVLQSSLPTTAPNGQDYKPVVIYMTDGVANIFLDSRNTWNFARDICPEYNGDLRALNTPRCQYDPAPGYLPHPTYGKRPISAMIEQAGKMKNTYEDLQLFVVALGQVNVLGLDEVASDPTSVFPARSADLVTTVLRSIKAKAEGPCIPTTAGDWISHIDSAHTAALTGGPPLPAGVYGYVYLTDDKGAKVSVPWSGPGTDPRLPGDSNAIPITQDGLGESLSYTVPTQNGLLPGVYRLKGAVYYKAAFPDGDGVSRQYDQLKPDLTSEQFMQFELTPSQALGSAVVLDPIRFKLRDDIVLCES